MINKQPENLYAQAYKPLSYLEGAIDNQLRGDDLKIITPPMSKGFSENEEITFNWETNNSQSFLLIIKDNTGKSVFETETPPPYKFQKKLKKGLYYWQLNTSDETLFTGKFLIR